MLRNISNAKVPRYAPSTYRMFERKLNKCFERTANDERQTGEKLWEMIVQGVSGNSIDDNNTEVWCWFIYDCMRITMMFAPWHNQRRWKRTAMNECKEKRNENLRKFFSCCDFSFCFSLNRQREERNFRFSFVVET